jgi:glycerol uptake facilitator-like aquaporin
MDIPEVVSIGLEVALAIVTVMGLSSDYAQINGAVVLVLGLARRLNGAEASHYVLQSRR